MCGTLLPLLTGCEETLSGTDFELPYREELIVQGFLTADGSTDTIRITRTLPPLDKWTIEKGAVTDAVAVISSEGVDYPLTHIEKGKYIARGLNPTIGKSYTINVTWKNLKLTGTATIPQAPENPRIFLDTLEGGCDYYSIDGESVKADMIRLILEYVPHGANMNSARVSLSYSYQGVPQFRDVGFDYFFYDIDSSGGTNQAMVYERCYFSDNQFEQKLDTIFLDFTEYEAKFRNFYETRWNGSGDDLFFGPSGDHPDWNITGDGFGWFFGRSVIQDTTVLK